ncbi:MAG: MATE family efflux transporter [SAR324 cluster bacterium]|nr:MATE family efflux transporter [SAR324 cluster bacterium]
MKLSPSAVSSENLEYEKSSSKWHSFIAESKLLFSLGIPLILAQLIQMSMGFVDTIMTGHFSAKDLAAVAIGEKSMIVIILFGIGTLSATQVLVAQLQGRNSEPLKIGFQVGQGIWIGQIYGVIAWVLVRNILPFLSFLEINPEVFAIAQDYMKAFSWGLPAVFLFTSFRGFYEGISISRLTFYFTLTGLLVNIIGNYTLIFGHFGAPRLGAVGAGWTSALANWVMALGVIIYTATQKRFFRYQIFSQLRHFSWTHIRPVLQIGTPVGVSYFVEVSVFVTAALMMVRFGTNTLAANQIAMNYAAFMFMVPLGLGMATVTRVGNALGRGNIPQARLIGWISIGYGGFFMTLSAITLFLFPEQIAGIYTNDAMVIKITSGFLMLAGIFQISDGIQVTAGGVLRGWKDTRFNMIVNLISFWGIGLGSGYYIAFVLDFGAEGLWYGLITGLSIQAFLLCCRLYYMSHRPLNH